MQALNEVKPAFGVEKDDFENSVRGGIINFSPAVEKILTIGVCLFHTYAVNIFTLAFT